MIGTIIAWAKQNTVGQANHPPRQPKPTPSPLPITLTLILIPLQPTQADTPAQAIALNCRNCHTPTTPATTLPTLPTLDNLTAQHIRQRLLDFKYDKIPTATLMPRLAKGYSDAELAAVAELLGKP